jgi:hypothetical protein
MKCNYFMLNIQYGKTKAFKSDKKIDKFENRE